MFICSIRNLVCQIIQFINLFRIWLKILSHLFIIIQKPFILLVWFLLFSNLIFKILSISWFFSQSISHFYLENQFLLLDEILFINWFLFVEFLKRFLLSLRLCFQSFIFSFKLSYVLSMNCILKLHIMQNFSHIWKCFWVNRLVQNRALH